MKILKYDILSVLALFVVALPLATSCTSADDDASSDSGYVQFGVAANWQQGKLTRAVTAVGAPEGPAIQNVYVMATTSAADLENLNFPIYPATTGDFAADDEAGYSQFHTNDPKTNIGIDVKDIRKYVYTAKAMYPETLAEGAHYTSEPWQSSEIPPLGATDYLYAEDDADHDKDVSIVSPHVLFTLKHQTSLVRFNLCVDSKYNEIRTFMLKRFRVFTTTVDGDGNTVENVINLYESTNTNDNGVVIGDTIPEEGKSVLPIYINPGATFETNVVTVEALYDVYDKDGQLTRSGLIAKNKMTLGVTDMKVGYYYDINTTLAPDFLYVLSDNDNDFDLILK